MELTWLGTAGFEISTPQETFYLDPYLSRNQDAVPVQPKTADDIKSGSPIFISHAHFDHLMDIPRIATSAGSVIYCSKTAGEYLTRKNVNPENILIISQNLQQFSFKTFNARALFSHHVVFDKKLVFSTLAKINVRLFKYLPYFYRYPCGQVLGWRFNLEGKSILFYGSAGATCQELEQTAKDPVDILLMPLQGHSDICDIGVDFVKILNPGIVIPHHHDNFFPPISRTVNIDPFLNGIKDTCPNTQVISPKVNQTICL